MGLIVSKFKRGVNWPFKIFSQEQSLTQVTENKSIYVTTNKFILVLFVCLKSVYTARLITKSADIFSRCSHTDIRTKNQWITKTTTFNFKQVIKVQLMAWQLIEWSITINLFWWLLKDYKCSYWDQPVFQKLRTIWTVPRKNRFIFNWTNLFLYCFINYAET